MPIYEYQCNNCHIKFEKIQKISEPAITSCPECNQNTVKKLISATRFRLKGGGWYETDFKNNNEKKLNLASSDNSSSTDPATTTKTTTTETKSEA